MKIPLRQASLSLLQQIIRYFTTANVTVCGTASGNVALNKVEVKVESGSYQIATGTESWSKSVTLASGCNTIYARATDTSGNIRETSITVTYNKK